MADRKNILLRLDPAVYDALARWANDELRSTTAQIELLLRRALADAGRMPRNVGDLPRRGRPPKSTPPDGDSNSEVSDPKISDSKISDSETSDTADSNNSRDSDPEHSNTTPPEDSNEDSNSAPPGGRDVDPPTPK